MMEMEWFYYVQGPYSFFAGFLIISGYDQNDV